MVGTGVGVEVFWAVFVEVAVGGMDVEVEVLVEVALRVGVELKTGVAEGVKNAVGVFVKVLVGTGV